MMISPEMYYEEYIKGKSPKIIIRQIRILKKEINKLKKELEDYNSESPEILTDPNPLTRIKVSRNYLQRAKEELENFGIKYEPTLSEKREIAFNESLRNVKNIFFYIGYIGGFNQGNEYWDISIIGNEAKCTHSSSITSNKEMMMLSKEEIIEAFENIHIGEWKRDYYNREKSEGTQWCLELEYRDGRRRIRISGSNAFPYNFEELTEFFESIS